MCGFTWIIQDEQVVVVDPLVELLLFRGRVEVSCVQDRGIWVQLL